jgi:hypothetical protein
MADTLLNSSDSFADVSKTSKKSSRMPTKEEDLKNVAKKVAAAWKASNLSLAWKKVGEFEKEITAFELSLDSKAGVMSGRKPVANELKKLDKEIDTNIEFVKNYLRFIKGKEDAKAYFEQFGIKKMGNSYKIPIDRDARQQSLKVLIDAFTVNNITMDKFGKEYWQNVYTLYQNYYSQTNTADSNIAGATRNKTELKDEIKKTLSAIGKLLEANYPDNYEKVLREWGFQKEKY